MKKILIADDEASLRFLITETLSMNENFEVTQASTGDEALKLYKEINPDIVILDVMMPNMTGYEVAEEIIKLGKLCKIIILTAKVQAQDIEQGKTIGIDEYITKPFSPMELLNIVQKLI